VYFLAAAMAATTQVRPSALIASSRGGRALVTSDGVDVAKTQQPASLVNIKSSGFNY